MLHFILYTDNLPEHSAGCANGPIIRIRTSHRDDKGILEHEKIHVLQWWCTFGLHSLLYLLSKPYRLNSEVEAYREQLKHNPEYVEKYAEWLSLPEPDGYGLQDICSKEQAVKLLIYDTVPPIR